jgi:hypothetical protein
MPKSILEDVGKIIDEALGLKGCEIGKAPHYRHRESCQRLSRKPMSKFNGQALIEKIYKQVNNNRSNKDPSEENWRWKKNPEKKDESRQENREKKLEVRLERKIVETSADWVNQVPTASGLVDEHSDKRGAIDLVHRLKDDEYEFIELKLRSDTPLYAAMEILQYGILYIFSRKDRKKLGYKEDRGPLLWAKSVHLQVLAPHDYYKGYTLDWLEDEICKGLKSFLVEQKVKLQIDFRFEAFPPSFTLAPFPENDAIAQALNNRRPVYLWKEGVVDLTKEHIQLFYGEYDEKALPVARVAPGTDRTFHVQFLDLPNLKGVERSEIMAEVRKELDFYLAELEKSDPWEYAKYHCTTASNVYGSVHWAYFPSK